MSTTTVGPTLKNYIAGEWVESQTERYEDIPNPATGEVLSRVPLSTKDDVDKAVQAAKAAFPAWSQTLR